eukprot:snap_masked-scaffold_10-processed-gene-12.44-mRNA-1 protein AED:1.00 eAED:1.00 QI:0/-1/0/0/-1/1/1/0/126
MEERNQEKMQLPKIKYTDSFKQHNAENVRSEETFRINMYKLLQCMKNLPDILLSLGFEEFRILDLVSGNEFRENRKYSRKGEFGEFICDGYFADLRINRTHAFFEKNSLNGKSFTEVHEELLNWVK